MENEICQVPVAAHVIIEANGKLKSTFEYNMISAKTLADLLIRDFGLDIIEE